MTAEDFWDQHGDCLTWSADDFEVYLDLTTPATRDTDGDHRG